MHGKIFNYTENISKNKKELYLMKQVKKVAGVLFTIISVLSLSLVIVQNYSLASQNQGSNSQHASEAQLLARCVNGEARGEPYDGQVAVAAVILNRVKHEAFPNTINGVIYQPGAFTAVTDGQINVPIDVNSTVYKACQDALNGSDPSGGAIYYYNPAKTTNKWIYSRQVVKTIGNHKFAI